MPTNFFCEVGDKISNVEKSRVGQGKENGKNLRTAIRCGYIKGS